MAIKAVERLKAVAAAEKQTAAERKNADPTKVLQKGLKGALAALKAAGFDAKQLDASTIRVHGDDKFTDLTFKSYDKKYGR